MSWLKKQKEQLTDEINRLINRCDRFTEVFKELKAEKTLLGGIKGVSWDEWQQLLSAAVDVDRAKQNCKSAFNEAAKAEDAKKTSVVVRLQRIKEKHGTRD
jgi:hypothetical protein